MVLVGGEKLRDKKVRRWLKANVYKVYLFRTICGAEKETKNPKEKKRLEEKMVHLRKKVDQLSVTGEMLGLTEEQIRDINLQVVKMMRNNDGHTPKTIIQQLLGEGKK